MDILNKKTLFCLTAYLAWLPASSAGAQSYLSPGYLFTEARSALGFVQPEPAPEFVMKARPDPTSLDYVPLKPPPRGFHLPENAPGERLAAQAPAIAELESARQSSQARAAANTSGASKRSGKTEPVAQEEDPPPMNWKPWDTD